MAPKVRILAEPAPTSQVNLLAQHRWWRARNPQARLMTRRVMAVEIGDHVRRGPPAFRGHRRCAEGRSTRQKNSRGPKRQSLSSALGKLAVSAG